MDKNSGSASRADVYARVTAEIVAAIESGVGEFRMPWHHDGAAASRPTNVSTSRKYRGVNTLALWVAAVSACYDSGLWGTYRQWSTLGAQVRKGEKAATVVLWKEIRATGDDDEAGGEDDDTDRRRMFAKAFSVFNLAQVDGYTPEAVPVLDEAERLDHAEVFIKNLGITTITEGTAAFYRPSTDIVVMPAFERFRDAASFYGVWLHECGHASGAKHRLDRDLLGRFGSEAYAFEEICVEILSGLVLADLGIAHHPRPDHAAYVASWLKVIKSDPRAIFTAASKAQQAADLLPYARGGLPTHLRIQNSVENSPW